MKIIKEGIKNIERTFRFFCDCGCVWEAKWYEGVIVFDADDKSKVIAVCACPYCGTIKKGVEK